MELQLDTEVRAPLNAKNPDLRWKYINETQGPKGSKMLFWPVLRRRPEEASHLLAAMADAKRIIVLSNLLGGEKSAGLRGAANRFRMLNGPLTRSLKLKACTNGIFQSFR
ncbi:hypothetical protein [Bradyrhizobium sp.]|uniref:hypothetical protein n=1 Tax=Bradyrhizobium sp. TaxID=376 RepID=UPI003C7509EB